MGVLSCGSRVSPNIQRPIAAKLCSTPKVLEMQERTRGPLSPCMFGRSQISPAAGAAKNAEFLYVYLSVRLSVYFFVRHAVEHHRLCSTFHHEGVGAHKGF